METKPTTDELAPKAEPEVKPEVQPELETKPKTKSKPTTLKNNLFFYPQAKNSKIWKPNQQLMN
jgi:hypothetical protein